jgi:hypothetical protein
MKHLGILLTLTSAALLLTACAHKSTSLWQCTASDNGGHMWDQQAPTRVEAAKLAHDRCKTKGYRPTCTVRCTPPIARWHCVSHDKGGHTWYWNSEKKAVAAKNAKAACLKNTTLGGCKMPDTNCYTT